MLAALVSSLLQRLICHVWGQHLYWSRDLLARGAGTFLPGESECMYLLFTSICLLGSSRAPLSILRQGNSEDSSSLFVNEGLLTAAPGQVFIQAISLCVDGLGTPVPPRLLIYGHSLLAAWGSLAGLLICGSSTWLWFSWDIKDTLARCEASVGERITQPVTSAVAQWLYPWLLVWCPLTLLRLLKIYYLNTTLILLRKVWKRKTTSRAEMKLEKLELSKKTLLLDQKIEVWGFSVHGLSKAAMCSIGIRKCSLGNCSGQRSSQYAKRSSKEKRP